jgi:hypothetical protein
MIYEIFAPTIAAATSSPFNAQGQGVISAVCNSLGASETITLQVYESANDVWANAINNGAAYQITQTTNFMTISVDETLYRFVKSATTSAVGLNINSLLALNGLTKL